MRLEYEDVKSSIVDRDEFYKAAKGVFGVIVTSDPVFYTNVILTKGVIGLNEPRPKRRPSIPPTGPLYSDSTMS